ncbi:unnamed protein product [Orchesella dallaii]|uniref:Ionotropic glutamate receptor C-terminal domain-containing protein n=1 Tax=Orchesella dallaii TaxID=48710 RepID=A0ABP1S8L0_9HEXA
MVLFVRRPCNSEIEDLYLDAIFSAAKSSGLYSFNLPVFSCLFNILSPNHSEVFRLSKNCAVGIIILTKHVMGFSEENLFHFLQPTPRHSNILRGSEDFFIFLTNSRLLAKTAITSQKIGAKLKFKVAFYPTRNSIAMKSTGRFETINSLDLNSLLFQNGAKKLFSLYPYNLKDLINGYTVKVSVPYYTTYFTWGYDANGNPKLISGTFYMEWLETLKVKYNFTTDYFLTSEGGSSATQHGSGVNESWAGGVGDVLNGIADISFNIAHTLERHGVVEWATPFFYSGIVFVVRKGKIQYPKNIILCPFTLEVWLIIGACISATVIFMKMFERMEAKHPVSEREISTDWIKMIGYVFATLLEQSRKLKKRNGTPFRIFTGFWLLFALVMATAFKAKLTLLMGFPNALSFATTFEQLAASEFSIGINGAGKAERTYTLFSSGHIKSYKKIFRRAKLFPDSYQCVSEAAARPFACIVTEGVASRSIAKVDQSRQLQISKEVANFVEGGVIYQREWKFGALFDYTIQNLKMMGLLAKYKSIDREPTSTSSTERAYSKDGIGSISTVEDSGQSAFKMKEALSCFVYLIVGLLLACLIFCLEKGVKWYIVSNALTTY